MTVSALQRSLLGGGEVRVDDDTRFDRVTLDDGSWIDVARGWLLGADTLFDALVDDVDWKQGRRRMYDRVLDDPRLSRWYAPGEPLPHAALETIGARLDRQLRVPLAGPALTTTATAPTASRGTPIGNSASSTTRASRS